MTATWSRADLTYPLDRPWSGAVTGRDPLSLGDREQVAGDFGFSVAQTHALQQIAHDQLAAATAFSALK